MTLALILTAAGLLLVSAAYLLGCRRGYRRCRREGAGYRAVALPAATRRLQQARHAAAARRIRMIGTPVNPDATQAWLVSNEKRGDDDAC